MAEKPCKHGHSGGRYANGACIGCCKKYSAAHAKTARVRHKDRNAASRKAWVATNKEKVSAISRRYELANKEKRAIKGALYAKNNRPACAATLARYRARKRMAGGRGVTSAQWRQILADSLGLCAYCQGRKKLTMDHIEPLNTGGLHDIDNIAACCGPCNSSKADHPLAVWLSKIRVQIEYTIISK